MQYIDMLPSFHLRETFHLLVLRGLAARLATRPYAVKGGICLRFFHHSPRLSEDMDLDISPSMLIGTLQKNVDQILGSAAILASLRAQGVQSLDFTKPKQTDTTQRWKIQLRLSTGSPLSTRIEFSRRKVALEPEKGSPHPALLQASHLSPYIASYYNSPAMIAQKMEALASPNRTAARDLFDLYHLFTQGGPMPNALPTIPREAAIDKVRHFQFNDFLEQVIPYLPEDYQRLYQDEPAFLTLRETVENRLKTLAS